MTTNASELPYRPCVGIVLFNRAGLVFVARRIDTKEEAWQMPQGGIDEGETPITAAARELEEEIGTNKAEIIAESQGWLQYDLPPELVGKVWKGRYRGQTQKWYAMRFLGEDSDINLDTAHPEFCAWRWEYLERLPSLIVPFKRKLYQDIVHEFAHLAAPVPEA
ncbi:RNA pyrophosphohydrolase [Pedomonas mirosovicensis]|uniref:RNA pyrophosphohydrolase n=1 Tax=Pedomonas mirosovicensis TaxID=2908641 RepID=UPI002167710B|nr:RNA pyrophosphohydrolase [Pedomonas mirosovicensis]MCH8684580.1 RNA pyrophosphohydrolase [Pedomonas mirosovicensis]